MHSQLMFNECIARSIYKDVHIHVRNIPMGPKTIFEVLVRFRFRERVELSYLPAADPEKEAQHIGLLLLGDLLEIFVGTHLRLTR